MSRHSSKSPVTRQSLLLRLRDSQDAAAWREFVEIYAPLIHAYGMRRGLQDADSADVAQQVLQSIAQAMPGFAYDPVKGSFRGWLFTITRNEMFRAFRRSKRETPGSGDTGFQATLNQQPGRESEEDVWNAEHQQRLFEWASQQAQTQFTANTWQAFSLVAVEGCTAAEAARRLGISVGAVYIAKSRVTSRIRELVQAIEPESTDTM